MTASRTVEPVDAGNLLRVARQTVTPVLAKAIAALPNPTRTVLAYHFGWCDSDGTPTNGNAGKYLRAALVLTSAQAVGAATGTEVEYAAAVEMVHNFTLLHDDVMDQDTTRRGRPTAWTVFGTAHAILAGDALLSLAFRQICQLPDPVNRNRSQTDLAATLLELVAGQCADLAFETRTDVGLAECLDMAAGKTASLLATACGLGARAAGGTAGQVSALRRCGWHLGLSFQLVDDLLGIQGDPRSTGKPVGNDLRRGKKSLPVAAAIGSGTAAGRELATLYAGADGLSDAEVARATELVARAGGLDWTGGRAAHHRRRALEALADADPRPEAVAAFTAIARLVEQRTA
jgi:geranylgeranyl diphosphate synthase type I